MSVQNQAQKFKSTRRTLMRINNTIKRKSMSTFREDLQKYSQKIRDVLFRESKPILRPLKENLKPVISWH